MKGILSAIFTGLAVMSIAFLIGFLIWVVFRWLNESTPYILGVGIMLFICFLIGKATQDLLK